MKIVITLKDPDWDRDVLSAAIIDDSPELFSKLNEEEKELLIEKRSAAILDKLKKWFVYEEYVNLEFDTNDNTMRVMPVGE